MRNTRNARSFRVCLRTIVLLFPVVTLLLFVTFPVSAQTSDGADPAAVAQSVLNDVNAAREQNGLPPLTVSPELTAAAQRHVEDVIANGNWGHYGSDGSNVQTRAARAGYPSSWVSENWVAVSNPERAITWWMNDWIHRVNILTSHWDEIGVGAALAGNGYWILVTDFGNRNGSASAVVDVGDPTGFSVDAGNDTFQTVPPGGMGYTIRGGDTLLGIAIRYGLDWQDVALVNSLDEYDLLQIGQTIWLPGRGGVGGPSALTTQVAAGTGRHVVRPGETLWTIAGRYAIEWQTLATLNGLDENDLLQIDEVLVLPAGVGEENMAVAAGQAPDVAGESERASKIFPGENRGTAVEINEDPAPIAEFTAASASDRLRTAPPPPRKNTVQRYYVRRGDTLSTVAERFGISWQLLAHANDQSANDFLQIGQALVIPSQQDGGGGEAIAASAAPGSPDGSVGAEPGVLIYRIKPGDTLFGIALHYGIDLASLLDANNLNEESILQPGQELAIP